MKSLVFAIVISCLLLLACGRLTQAPVTPEEGNPIFTDADIDSAQLQIPADVKTLVGVEEDTIAQGTSGLVEGSSDLDPQGLGPQAVLPNTSGFVYYARFLLGFNGANSYSLYRHDETTDVYTLLYSGDRQIQSVTGSADGTVVLVSMRETTSSSSDFEIFLLSLSDPNNPVIIQFTNDSVDNINVSMSRNFGRFVYEESIAGIPTVIIMKNNGFLSFSKTILTNTLGQRQPSVSGDSRYVSLIRDLPNGNDRIFTYDIALNAYQNVATSTAFLEYPSLSNDGLKVAWLENGTTDQVVLKNLITGTTQTVASDTFMGHPFLTADGKFIVYGSGRAIVTKDLRTGETQTVASSIFSTLSYYAPSWQKTFENKFVGARQSGVYPSSLGTSVAVDGDVMVAAATGETNGAGAVYVYQRNLFSGNWTVVKRLTASDGAMNTFFGSDVALSGDTIVVGAKEAAYIFKKNQGGTDNWGEVKKLLASDAAADDRFGDNVTISGNTVVISAYFEDHDTNGVAGDELDVGAAYIFQRNLGGTNNWGQRKKLVASDHTASDWFGCDLSMSGTTLIVGACGESHDTNGISGDEFRVGAAYLFEQNQGGTNTFGQVKKLIANDGSVSDQLGFSVAISGTTVVVSAYSDDRNVDGVTGDELNVGSAYIFQKDQGGVSNWGQVKKIVANDGSTWDLFGHAVSISGNSVVVGAYLEAHDTNNNGSDETRVGAAYLFQKDQGSVDNWGQVRKLTAFDGTTDDSFSEGAVAISGGVVVVGAWSDDNASGGNAGAIYIYE
jgi:hypothetical protein